MKKLVLYFDPAPQKILVEKASETGEKKHVLSSPNNFVYTAEILARVIEYDYDDQIKTKLDSGYDYYHLIDFVPLKAGEGIIFDQTISAYRSSFYGFVVFDGKVIKLLSPVTVSKDKVKAYLNICPTKF